MGDFGPSSPSFFRFTVVYDVRFKLTVFLYMLFSLTIALRWCLPHSILLTLYYRWATYSEASIAFVCCIISHFWACCFFQYSILNSWWGTAVCNCNLENNSIQFCILSHNLTNHASVYHNIQNCLYLYLNNF